MIQVFIVSSKITRCISFRRFQIPLKYIKTIYTNSFMVMQLKWMVCIITTVIYLIFLFKTQKIIMILKQNQPPELIIKYWGIKKIMHPLTDIT